MHTIKPLDTETILKAANETEIIVTVEEHFITGGLGSAVSEVMAEQRINSKLLRIGLPDKFIEHGSQQIIRHKYGLDDKGIIKTIKKFLAE